MFTPHPLKSLFVLLGCALAGLSHAQTVRETVPQVQPALSSEGGPVGAFEPGAVRTLSWTQLIPAGWDPYKEFQSINLNDLKDNDPRTEALLKKMRKIWDAAPINPLILGQTVRLPGFLVPLEELPEGLKEFLLVPYFGACIHTPPPPANQIVHVLLDKPVKRFRSMDTVWVTGVLSATKTDSYMGVASYRLEAKGFEPYKEKGK